MKLKITLLRSTIGRLENQKRIVKALGFSKRGQTIVIDDSPVVRGMIDKVKHLITTQPVDGE
jgi:large subunit ribosomal protein L30